LMFSIALPSRSYISRWEAPLALVTCPDRRRIGGSAVVAAWEGEHELSGRVSESNWRTQLNSDYHGQKTNRSKWKRRNQRGYFRMSMNHLRLRETEICRWTLTVNEIVRETRQS
jgi:hypothetical protein